MDLIRLMKQMSLRNDEESVNEANLKISVESIEAHHTDIAFCEFTNQFFIVATQYGKAGSCMKVAKEQLETEVGVEFIYGVTPVFGSIDLEQETTARYVAEFLDIKKPLIIFINLLKYDKETVRAVASAIKNLSCR